MQGRVFGPICGVQSFREEEKEKTKKTLEVSRIREKEKREEKGKHT